MVVAWEKTWKKSRVCFDKVDLDEIDRHTYLWYLSIRLRGIFKISTQRYLNYQAYVMSRLFLKKVNYLCLSTVRT